MSIHKVSVNSPYPDLILIVNALVSEVCALREQLGKNANQHMSTKQAAAYTGYTESTLRAKAEQREIPCAKIGTRLVFSRQDLDDWVASHKRLTKQEIKSKAREA